MKHIHLLSGAKPKPAVGNYPNDHKKCQKLGKCAAQEVMRD